MTISVTEHNAIQNDQISGASGDAIQLFNGSNYNWLKANRLSNSGGFFFDLSYNDGVRLHAQRATFPSDPLFPSISWESMDWCRFYTLSLTSVGNEDVSASNLALFF